MDDYIATFESVIDGDTIVTSAGTIRLIGIDTPERGECGHDEASSSIRNVISQGEEVRLSLPEGQNNMDRYGRLIRYAETMRGIDLGLLQLQKGNAIARYDSTDGYPQHPRQVQYHASQLVQRGSDGSFTTLSCAARGIAPTISPTPPADRWWEAYSSCSKLKKNKAGHNTGPFSVDRPEEAEIYDWFANRTGHRGDGDGDGLACE